MHQNFKTLLFTYVDIEGYSKTPNHFCYENYLMTATDSSDAAKECSATTNRCHMCFYHSDGSFNACERTASIYEDANSILYLPQGNKLYKWF